MTLSKLHCSTSYIVLPVSQVYRPGKTMGDAEVLISKHTCTILTRVKYVPVFAFLNVSVTIKIDLDFSTVGSIIESYLKIQCYIRNRTSKIAFQKNKSC